MPIAGITAETFRSNATSGVSTEFSLTRLLSEGAVPPEYLGLNTPNHGDSLFSSVAHRTQQLKQVDNMINNSVADQLSFQVSDRNGKVTTPFNMGGIMMRPDAEGNVRIVDQANINLARQIKEYRRKRVDGLMDIAMDGDGMCAYVFGVPMADWLRYCDVGGAPPGVVMDKSLKDLKCSVEYIESLAPSLTQTQSIAKLRKLVEHFEKNVNIEGLSNVADVKSNMKDGHNNPNNLGDEGIFTDAGKNMKASNAVRRDAVVAPQ